MEKEDWIVIEIESEKSKINFRTIVTRIVKLDVIDPVTGLSSFASGYQNIASVKSETKGTPSPKLPMRAEIPKLPKYEVNFKHSPIEWNSYFVEEEKVYYDVKPIITQVFRIENYFDLLGYPHYWVLSQPAYRVKEIKDE